MLLHKTGIRVIPRLVLKPNSVLSVQQYKLVRTPYFVIVVPSKQTTITLSVLTRDSVCSKRSYILTMATKSKKFSKEDELLLQDFSRGVSTKVRNICLSQLYDNMVIYNYFLV